MAMAMGMQVGVPPTLQQAATGTVRRESASLHFSASPFCGRFRGAAVGAVTVKAWSSVQVSCGAATAVDGTAVTGTDLHSCANALAVEVLGWGDCGFRIW
jgi:hypothetical protein